MKFFIRSFFAILIGFNTQAQTEKQIQAQAAFSAGVKKLQSTQYKEAVDDFTTAINDFGVPEGTKMAYVYRAMCKNGLGKYDEAIEDYNQAIAIDPDDFKTYIDRAQSKLQSGNVNAAIDDYMYILVRDTTSKMAQNAFYFMGKIEQSKGNYDQAIDYYSKILALSPADAEVYFLRGSAKDMIMDSEGAIADYSKAIQYNPRFMQAYANRGVQKVNKLPVEKKTGKIKCLEDACADLKKAKALGDTSQLVLDMLERYCKKCK